MDIKRFDAGVNLLQAAEKYWSACHEEKQYGAVQWLLSTDGDLVIYARGEYLDQLMENIDKLPSATVHKFGERLPELEKQLVTAQKELTHYKGLAHKYMGLKGTLQDQLAEAQRILDATVAAHKQSAVDWEAMRRAEKWLDAMREGEE